MVRGIKKYTAFILIIVLMTLTACAGGDRDIATPADNQDKHDETEVTAPEDKKVEENENEEPEEVSLEEEEEMQPPVDLKGLKVNELGKIRVLMYHGIGEEEDVWVRTPENFRKDLQTLYDKGYRAIGMKDYIEGNIDTPPGTTPVIITFDDGLQGQFNVLGDGDEFVVDPNCAVGILEDFNKVSDFGLKATFYVFYNAL